MNGYMPTLMAGVIVAVGVVIGVQFLPAPEYTYEVAVPEAVPATQEPTRAIREVPGEAETCRLVVTTSNGGYWEIPLPCDDVIKRVQPQLLSPTPEDSVTPEATKEAE